MVGVRFPHPLLLNREKWSVSVNLLKKVNTEYNTDKKTTIYLHESCIYTVVFFVFTDGDDLQFRYCCTEYIFEYFYVDINALDADGNIIGTGNVSQITNWNPGQKAEVDAWVNTNDASKISETTFTAHYKSGNFYK